MFRARLLEPDLVLVDTPGSNDDKMQTSQVLDVLRLADVIVWVLRADISLKQLGDREPECGVAAGGEFYKRGGSGVAGSRAAAANVTAGAAACDTCIMGFHSYRPGH